MRSLNPSLGIAALVAVMIASGCGPRRPEAFSQLAEEFVYGSLALSPVGATAAGYHEHKGVRLDEMLDDLSPAGIERQRNFYREFRRRLTTGVRAGDLPADDRADYDILADQIALGLLELDEIQNWRHNPTLYVELIGNALFLPHVLDYAPRPQRVRHIIARMEKIPAFLDQARKNLAGAPDIWTTTAIEENDGNIGLIDKIIRINLPEGTAADYDRAAATALAALRGFQDYLKNDLANRQTDWRLAPEKYRKKFRYVLATDRSPEQVLDAAEAELKAVRAKVSPDALAKIALRHSTPENYIRDARRDLEEARQFVKATGLLPLPSRDNLQVIETPEFMRGIYAVGGFMSAPPLEPQLGAFYWLTPIPKQWPPERVESKLREYNFFKLKLLTIHEAMPGHYVQLEYANDVQPKTRRVLRSVFGNGPYIEGWGQYSTQIMLDAGYLGRSPELRMTFQKEELRVLANAILDIRLHTMGMTDQQAMDLMEIDTLQEKEEATAKLRRAKLSSCQLPMYYVGWRDWIRVREHYQRWKGDAYNLAEFNEQALKAGAAPLPVLARLLTGKGIGE